MLELAIKAGIPLISLRTDDLLNLELLLKDASGDRPFRFLPDLKMVPEGGVGVVVGEKEGMDTTFYQKLVEKEVTFILVNQDEPHPLAFDVGTVYPSNKLLKRYLTNMLNLNGKLLASSVSGLTIQKMVDIIRLTQVEYGDLTPTHIRHMRHRLFGMTKGLMDVEVHSEFYLPNPELEQWITLNKKFFMEAPDVRLIPRGVLLAGPPGVGKTMGAKEIARKFECPLYRIDLSGALSKYVGESESNFNRVLSVVDKEEPCVLLMDEVEKVFSNQSDGTGTSSRILSQLLWWLQEHTSRVLAVMTTNNQTILPPELYRAGRIDATIPLSELTGKNILHFARSVFKQFSPTSAQGKLFDNHLDKAYSDKVHGTTLLGTISHAQVVADVHEYVKNHLFKE